MTDTVYHDLAQRILDDSDHDFLVAIRKAVSQSECDFTGNYRMAALEICEEKGIKDDIAISRDYSKAWIQSGRRTMRISLIVIASLILIGCQDPTACEADIQAEQIAQAYDLYFAATPITESQRLCVHDFVVEFETHRRVNNDCHTSGVAGCASFPSGTSPRLFVSTHGSERHEAGTLRHELTHLMLFCATGDAHPAHDVPEFNFHDGPTDEQGTLMWWAKRTPVPGYACMP